MSLRKPTKIIKGALTNSDYEKMDAWRTCKRCPLYKTRRNVVIGQGTIPADILFIGEGPGKTEDLKGIPFIGASGKLFREALSFASMSKSQYAASPPVSYYITNIVSCRPTESRQGANRPPLPEEANSCLERLLMLESYVKPKEVVLLGKEASKYCLKHWPFAHELRHPAYVLRRGGRESTEYRQFLQGLLHVVSSVLDVRNQENLGRGMF